MSALNALEQFSGWQTWSPAQKRKLLYRLKYDFSLTARPSQIFPDDDSWDLAAVIGGRAFGKTRLATEFIKKHALARPGTRISLVGMTYAASREIALTGESGLLAVTPPKFIKSFNSTRGLVVFTNGSIVMTFSGADPERLRGVQSHIVVLDEFASYPYAKDTYDMAKFGLRLGVSPKMLVTTTPKPTKEINDLVDECRVNPRYILRTGSTYENAANLPSTFIRDIEMGYDGTELGKQELHGQLLTALQGALWAQDDISNHRVMVGPTRVYRRVIAIDPAATSAESNDMTGIIMASLADRVYIEADMSCREPALEWAKKVVAAYHKYSCDAIIVEENNGGEAWRTIIHQVDPTVYVKGAFAKVSKEARAQPVAALYPKGLVRHVGTHAMLESQMALWEPTTKRGPVVKKIKSPDRIDALVWAVLDFYSAVRHMLGAAPGGVFTAGNLTVLSDKQDTMVVSPTQELQQAEARNEHIDAVNVVSASMALGSKRLSVADLGTVRVYPPGHMFYGLDLTPPEPEPIEMPVTGAGVALASDPALIAKIEAGEISDEALLSLFADTSTETYVIRQVSKVTDDGETYNPEAPIEAQSVNDTDRVFGLEDNESI